MWGEDKLRLNKQSNYALRIMMYCAANPEANSRIPEIAAAYGLSELFLFKILQPLVAAKLVQTTRGRAGGVSLAKPPDRISVLEVVRVSEPDFVMADCFRDDYEECPLIDHCKLTNVLREALNAFFSVLASFTIADLVDDRTGMRNRLGIEKTI